MNNAQIIFTNAMDLMNKGIIGTTGRTLYFKKQDGTVEATPEPEEIHTYADWKLRGYQVQKGEKAIARFTIWMYTSKPNKKQIAEAEAEGKEAAADPHYYMKEACFFSASQVGAIQREKQLPAVVSTTTALAIA